MGCIRVEKSRNYTVMSNEHLRNNTLSLKAKGLLSMVLSLPDDWNYSIEGLTSICKESKHTVESVIKELKEHGYLEIIKKLPNDTTSGRFEYEYVFYENSQKQEPKKQEPKKQGVEIQGVEKQGVVFCPQLNTDNKLNTKKLNTKKLKKEEINTENTTYSLSDIKSDARKKKSEAIEDIVQYWNSTLGKYGIAQIKKISSQTSRYKMLVRRIEDYGVDEVKSAIDNIENSDFLKGNNGWMITFDWFVKPNNFIKVYENNYANKTNRANNSIDWDLV